MRRRTALLVVAIGMATLVTPASDASPTFTKSAVSFTVTNPGDPLGGSWMVKGFLVLPGGCTPQGVLLAQHGLSYGQWAWDFPLRPETYSVAQNLAGRGYAMIAIDELGYGESHGEGHPNRPNGYTLSVEAYAAMTAQIIEQIRSGGYGGPAFAKVGLIGHSAGTEISELTTALYPDLVDALIATAYTHVPFVDNDWLVREWSQTNFRALQSDYAEFEQGVRSQDMHYLPKTDADVAELDNALANLTPSGEIFSIGLQPSRFLLPTITEPVLLLLADKDALFPANKELVPGLTFGQGELMHFAGSSDATLKVVNEAGHSFMLEQNAPIANDMIGDWLDDHQQAVPGCALSG